MIKTVFFDVLVAKVNLKVSDLRCDKYLQDSLLVLVLEDKESGREILLPVSDYEFRCIKNLVFKTKISSYIDNLSKTFFFSQNELIIQDEEVKSKLTFSTIENFTQNIVLPPIESLLYCAEHQVDIIVEEETFQDILKLNLQARTKRVNNFENVKVGDVSEQEEENRVLKMSEKKPSLTGIKDSNIDFYGNANVFNLEEKNRNDILNLEVTKENVKAYSSEDLVLLLKNFLSGYNYENVMTIQEELNGRHINFWHEICEDDFL